MGRVYVCWMGRVYVCWMGRVYVCWMCSVCSLCVRVVVMVCDDEMCKNIYVYMRLKCV